ncbi:hypothetical protein COL154_003286 [Colletotrichum chrysophilum]|nr:hypothetical protein COL154_003286 [Colletotrichum chrysophilum]
MAPRVSESTKADRDNIYVRSAFNYVDAINKAVTELTQTSLERVRDCMSKQAVVELAPSSMTTPGKEDSINSADEHVAFIGLMRGLIKEANRREIVYLLLVLTRWQVEIFDWVYAAGPRVILQAKANGRSHHDQPYVNDLVFFMDFVDVNNAAVDEFTEFHKQEKHQDRAGLPKLTFIREYIDSAFFKGYMDEEMKRAKSNNMPST